MQHLCSSASRQTSAALLPGLDFFQEIIEEFCFTLPKEGETYLDERLGMPNPLPHSRKMFKSKIEF